MFAIAVPRNNHAGNRIGSTCALESKIKTLGAIPQTPFFFQ